jgi:hypothetical protein
LLKLLADIAQADPTYSGVFCDLCDFHGVPDLFPNILGVRRNPAIGQAENAFGENYGTNFAQESHQSLLKTFGISLPTCRRFNAKSQGLRI